MNHYASIDSFSVFEQRFKRSYFRINNDSGLPFIHILNEFQYSFLSELFIKS